MVYAQTWFPPYVVTMGVTIQKHDRQVITTFFSNEREELFSLRTQTPTYMSRDHYRTPGVVEPLRLDWGKAQ